MKKIKITKKGLWAVTHFGMIGAGLAVPVATSIAMVIPADNPYHKITSTLDVKKYLSKWIDTICTTKKHIGDGPAESHHIFDNFKKCLDSKDKQIVTTTSEDYIYNMVITERAKQKMFAESDERVWEVWPIEKYWLFGFSIASIILLLLYGNIFYLPQRTRRAVDEKHAEVLGKIEGTKVDVDKDLLIKKIRINALQLKINNGSITDKEIKELEKLVK